MDFTAQQTLDFQFVVITYSDGTKEKVTAQEYNRRYLIAQPETHGFIQLKLF